MQAKVITPKRAIQVAGSIVKADRQLPDDGTSDMAIAYTARTGGQPDFYVVNKKKGFVIVSADDVIGETVLGYSDTGQFDYNSLPENAKWWLSQYQQQIDKVRTDGGEAVFSKVPKRSKKTAAGAASDIVVPPLLGDILWAQSKPYNLTCPTVNGEQAVTGCVATAMAQVMYFHNWPLQGTGSHTYTDSNKNTYSANFAQSHYEWYNMIPRYSSWTTAQGNAVAQLMYDCGVSVDMTYVTESGGSGAVSSNVHTAMKTYFGYSSDAKYKQRSTTGDKQWNQILKTELDAYRPIIYGGSSSEGAHAFVVDGYTSDEYFHFNFGWGGSGNGYFLSTVAGKYSKSQSIKYGLHANNDANRKKAGGLYYNILGNGEVAVTYPKSKDEYTGDVTVPDKVVIDGTEYSVTHIGNVAFANCTGLTSVTLPSSVKLIGGNAFFGCGSISIVVPWKTPLATYYSTFSDDICNTATIVVPQGAVASYSAAEGWNRFASITDGNTTTADWGEWKPFENGAGTYFYTGYDTNGRSNDEVSVKIRQSKTNSNLYQVLAENVGLTIKEASTPGYITYTYGGHGLIINLDMTTNMCTVPKQVIGHHYSKGDIYVSDMPTYKSSNTYSRYPCVYDPDDCKFKLYLKYYYKSSSIGDGTDTLIVESIPKDYTLTLNAGELQELDDDNATLGITCEMGDDIEYIRYYTYHLPLTDDLLSGYIQKILDGTVGYSEIRKGGNTQLTADYPSAGKYTTIVCAFNKDNTMVKSAVQRTAFYPQKNWEPLGTALYNDDFVPTAFPNVSQYEYQVEVEQNVKFPGRYRIKNPYGKAYTPNAKGSLTTEKIDAYLQINAEDPTAIYLPASQAMNVTLNAKTVGEMIVSSKAADMLAEGKTLEEAKAAGVCGQFDGSVITFPAGALTVLFPVKSDQWMDSNLDGAFRLDLTGLIQEPSAAIIQTSNVNIEAGNQAPMQVSIDANGQTYVSMQCDIHLPEGITPVTDDDGNIIFDRSDDLSDDIVIDGNRLKESDCTLRIVVYSADNTPLTNGLLFTLYLSASKDIEAGTYPASLTGITLTTADLEKVNAPDVTSDINVSAIVAISQPETTEGKNGNAPMYNIQGMKVNRQYKGVVITNGKKVLNR